MEIYSPRKKNYELFKNNKSTKNDSLVENNQQDNVIITFDKPVSKPGNMVNNSESSYSKIRKSVVDKVMAFFQVTEDVN